MPAQKPADEMTEDELREWEQRLFTDGVNPVPIRQGVPTSVSSYGWDSDLDATVEHTNGSRYLVGIRDGKLTRLALLEPVNASESMGSRAAIAARTPAPQTAHPNLPGVRKRKLA